MSEQVQHEILQMPSRPQNFALIGAAGYIAPRHLQAIHETGNSLVAAVDPHQSVGLLDRHFPEAQFFTEIERFDRFMEKCRRQNEDKQIDYVSICSPNYLHDAHIRLALRVKANAICEKPLVLNPSNIDYLLDLEQECDRKVFPVLQLRLHPAICALKESLEQDSSGQRADICLTYVTRRGSWYNHVWKGSDDKSGGLAMNIGIHFFDVLLWLFGQADRSEVHISNTTRMAGVLELERARVRWFLSIDGSDLPDGSLAAGKPAYRSLTIDGQEVDFSEGFTDLHQLLYQEILAGRGFSMADARDSIKLAHGIRHSHVTTSSSERHPFFQRAAA